MSNDFNICDCGDKIVNEIAVILKDKLKMQALKVICKLLPDIS